MMLTSVTMVTVLLFVDIQRCRSGKELLGSVGSRGCDPVSNKNLIFFFYSQVTVKNFLLVIIYLKLLLLLFLPWYKNWRYSVDIKHLNK